MNAPECSAVFGAVKRRRRRSPDAFKRLTAYARRDCDAKSPYSHITNAVAIGGMQTSTTCAASISPPPTG
jgi:hypothetical protein